MDVFFKFSSTLVFNFFLFSFCQIIEYGAHGAHGGVVIGNHQVVILSVKQLFEGPDHSNIGGNPSLENYWECNGFTPTQRRDEITGYGKT